MQRNTHTCKFFLIKNGEISEEWRRERRKRKRAKEEGEKKEHRYQKKKKDGVKTTMTRLQRVRMPYATISLQTTQQKKKKRTPEKPYFVAVAFFLSLSLSLS